MDIIFHFLKPLSYHIHYQNTLVVHPIYFEMIYYNSDGLKSSMCGNGARCAVAYAYERNICSREASFMAYDGVHRGFVLSNSIIKLSFKDISRVEENNYGLVVDSGSPHLIIFKKNLDL